jgi:ribosomal protein S18 acetylase RimI-like enzyme
MEASIKMDVTIKKLTNKDMTLPIVIDDRFIIDSVLCLKATSNSIQYTVKNISPYEKRYSEESESDDQFDLAEYIDNPDQLMYVAIAENEIIGQVIVRKNWNQMAYIEDIKVNRKYRMHGIGRQLLDKVKEWAKHNGMIGIMLETQHNNVGACKFYEQYGFVIGGFDRYIYNGMENCADEIAVFWYLILE